MMYINHLSDLHFGKKGNDSEANVLADAIIANESPQLSIVAISGDLMDSPSHRCARRVGRFIRKFRHAGFHVVAVPGNHDLYPNGIDSGLWIDANRDPWNKYIEPQLSWQSSLSWPRLFVWNGLYIIGVDTQGGTAGDGEIDLAQGRVDDAQIRRLLLMVQDKPCIVIGHHRLFWNDVFHRLENAEQIVKLLSGQALAWICGHKHEASIIERDGLKSIASRRSTQREDGKLIYTKIAIDEHLTVEQIQVG